MTSYEHEQIVHAINTLEDTPVGDQEECLSILMQNTDTDEVIIFTSTHKFTSTTPNLTFIHTVTAKEPLTEAGEPVRGHDESHGEQKGKHEVIDPQ